MRQICTTRLVRVQVNAIAVVIGALLEGAATIRDRPLRRLWMNHRTTLVCVPLLLMMSGEALAGTICWIEKVVTDRRGVRIFFISNMPLSGAVVAANKATPRRQFRIEEGKVHWIKGTTEPSLLLKPGEWAPLIGGVENTCRISFDEELDQRGVTAEASFTPPDQPMSATQFIPAE